MIWKEQRIFRLCSSSIQNPNFWSLMVHEINKKKSKDWCFLMWMNSHCVLLHFNHKISILNYIYSISFFIKIISTLTITKVSFRWQPSHLINLISWRYFYFMDELSMGRSSSEFGPIWTGLSHSNFNPARGWAEPTALGEWG